MGENHWTRDINGVNPIKDRDLVLNHQGMMRGLFPWIQHMQTALPGNLSVKRNTASKT